MENSIELGGIFSEGYGVIPKKLMRLKLNDKIGKQKGKNVKLVLAYMLSYTGSGNQCFPAIRTIAEDLEISTDTVVDAIKNACKLGLISKSQMYPSDPLKHNHKYILEFLTSDSNIDVRESRITCDDGSNYVVQTFEQNNNSINNNSINNRSGFIHPTGEVESNGDVIEFMNNKNKTDFFEKVEKVKKKPKRFIKPTIEQIAEYCKERGNNIDPQYYYDKNESIGWVVGKNRTPMKDWKANIRTWERNTIKETQGDDIPPLATFKFQK